MDVNGETLYVIDASFVVAHFLPDEANRRVDEYFSLFEEGEIDFISSTLLPFEVINGFKIAFSRKRIKLDQFNECVKEFINLRIDLIEAEFEKVAEVAIDTNLSIYDAAYLYLSQTTSFPLLSLDKHLR